jgi:hypothetical protein
MSGRRIWELTDRYSPDVGADQELVGDPFPGWVGTTRSTAPCPVGRAKPDESMVILRRYRPGCPP